MENTLFARRNGAIDMLRGLTMLLMVFVNDLWTVGDVPHWLEHFERLEDGMGLADIVFPMFLFAMGMSVPYAIESRFSKGYSGESTLGHILSRTLALLLMGVFIVNTEGGFDSTLGYGVSVYRLLMVAAFFLIWNQYGREFKWKKPLQICGVAVLAFLAFTFRTPEGGYFSAQWWGILGIIGWTYCFVAVTYLLARKKPSRVVLVWIGLCVLNLLMTRMRDGSQIISGPSFISDMAAALKLVNAPYAVMAVGGMLLSLAENRIASKSRSGRKSLLAAFGAAAALAAAAAVCHRWWIVSKLVGTLPWCLYVSAISVAVYALLRVSESYKKTSWFRPLSASGTATLTVYMMPYVLYSVSSMVGLASPDWLSGPLGLLKCVIFSLLCVALTSLLVKFGIKLKI
jgi:predicted acyltransferase